VKTRMPSLDARRAAEFEAELLARARNWLPEWGVDDDPQDFGRALLSIAARFDAEVAEQLDRAGEKMQRGFVDWLGLRANAAKPARMPVVMRMGERAVEPVLARAPVRLQADAGGASVAFETEGDVRVLPGRLEVVVATDADADELFFPAPGLTSVEPVPPAPTQWRVKTFVGQGSSVLQLDPDAGLSPGMLVEVGAAQYRIEKAEKDIVTIDPPLDIELDAGTLVTKVESFTPFDRVSRNRQQHALYIGHLDLLNIESAATIDVVGAKALADVQWQYWGKLGDDDSVGWQGLTLSTEPPQPADAVRLQKPRGAIEPRGVASITSSRWIRAVAPRVGAAVPQLFDAHIHLRINDQALPSCPLIGDAPVSPTAQALANTTPLVLASTFYPLGKTPRQFDAFYLGCVEAFSKKHAKVQLCVGLADPTFAALSAVRSGDDADRVVAGVGEDRALHLFAVDPATGSLSPFLNREALQPPMPTFGGLASASPLTALVGKPRWRLPVWSEGPAFRVAVAAGSHIWVWAENTVERLKSGWLDYGELPQNGSPGQIAGLVFLDDGAAPKLVALQAGGAVSIRPAGQAGSWVGVATELAGATVKLAAIAPVWRAGAANEPLATGRFVGVGDDDTAYLVEADPVDAKVWQCTEMNTANMSASTQPAGFDLGGDVLAIGVHSTLPALVAAGVVAAETAQPLAGDIARGGSFEGMFVGAGRPVALSLLTEGTQARLAAWSPTAQAPEDELFKSDIESDGQPDGAPTAVAGQVIVPGSRADMLASRLQLTLRLKVEAEYGAGIAFPSSAVPLAPFDIIAVRDPGGPEIRQVIDGPITHGGETFHPLDSPFPTGAAAQYPFAFRVASVASIGKAGATLAELELLAGDLRVHVGMLLQTVVAGVSTVHEVADVDDTVDPRVATLDTDLPAGTMPGTAVDYRLPEPLQVRLAPFARLNPALPTQRIEGAVAASRRLLFASPTQPASQGAAVFMTAGPYATLLVFDAPWTASAPQAPDTFRVDASVGPWTHQSGSNASNPELSWEYWNGAWSKLTVTDQTFHLKSSGALTFDVPDDIQATDWAGKTDFWVRARLTGGDYGSETVKVRNTPQPDGSSVQTIERSTAGIKPPAVVSLVISYGITEQVLPDFLLAEDSGTVRDQSAANRTPSASVEAFVPLSITLGRLRRDTAAAVADANGTTDTEGCGGDCPGCGAGAAAEAAGTGGGAASVAPATGRALFLGFSSPLSGASVNVLSLAARETNHDAFAPLKVEVLVSDRFMPVTTQDGSRALGETGLLTFAFGDAPTQAEFFGRALRWVRIAPALVADGAAWDPSLAGLYLNAVWASATETLTRERIGSSEGAPGLTLRLARPPLLDRSLELRVREPLGDEEREALRSTDRARVLADPDLPGDWVLWTPVNDPADSGPDDRVYALDERSGEIRFGDGTNGLIPPIGRDNIVAFRYQRTEPPAPGAIDLPANAIPARAQVNLVTPVEGVEAVFSADHAAGGSPPEPDESVLRNAAAKLRHRGRALTMRDFEDLALASSPRIAQARALMGLGGVRLVVAMSGDSPQPGSAQRRELKRRLLSLAPASLGAAALTITGPRERELRVALRLRVDSLERAGAVRDDCARRLIACFDAARGGNGEGWPIGACPREQDVARALDGVTHLDAIATLSLAEALPGGGSGPWPAVFRTDELVRVADKNVLVTFDNSLERA
jgi:hypothetical protein